MQELDSRLNIIADGDNFLSEINHGFKTLFRLVCYFADSMALYALHKVRILVRLHLVEHLKDVTSDQGVIRALILEPLGQVHFEIC